MIDVSLAIMPFGPIHTPNLGISILKSLIETNEMKCKIHYFNLKMANNIGVSNYDLINEHLFKFMIGEKLFSNYLFNRSSKWKNYFYNELKEYSKNFLMNFDDLYILLKKIKKYIPEFMKDCLFEIMKDAPKVIGFSSSYQQNCSSLIIAKKIKERCDSKIIFGGSNLDGEMGLTLLKCFNQIDYVCSGDGETAFVEFLKNYNNEKKLSSIKGIFRKNSFLFQDISPNTVTNMECLPFPNFDDYFTTITRYNLNGSVNLR